ncbi:MAG TPA: F0F1 ATP synthase subunit A [Chitinophagales bacterium]|nr:F0F1 ATP synthase subunit A [Chitinophagales bacterium]
MKYTLNTYLKHISTAVFIAFLASFSFGAFAQEHEGHGTETTTTTEHPKVADGESVAEEGHEKFDAGKMITEHVSDAHDWHILDWGGHAVAVPLPIILYTDKGMDFFMSSKFEHGHAVVPGHYNYMLKHNNIVAVNEAGETDEAATANVYDFSITKNVATLFFSVTVLILVFLSVAGAYKKNPNKAPSGLQSFMEPLIIFIRDDVAKPAIGPKYEKFLPYLLSVFFIILINNLLGLVPIIPGGANLSGNIAFTMVLAVGTFIITSINGTKHYWHHIIAMPGVPKPVLLILTPIEILGVFLRPFVLMIRLFANMTAGHIIALSFFALIFIFGELSTGAGFGVSIVSIAFTVFMGLLEILVAFLQAYVFTLLSAMYFGSAVEEPHHGDAHH